MGFWEYDNSMYLYPGDGWIWKILLYFCELVGDQFVMWDVPDAGVDILSTAKL